MSDYITLPLQAHDNRSVFHEHAWIIGRAYRNQAIELISICQFLSRLAPPMLAHEDAELRRIRRVCDVALRSAADSGTEVTDEANARFKDATETLSNHSERRLRIDSQLAVYSKMELAKRKDGLESHCQHPTSDKCARSMIINFVLLRSPVLSPHDPETIVVSQELSAGSPLPEIFWNFSRYKDRARITLEQNPHFYLRCPEDKSAYTPMFQCHPLRDTSGALEHNDTLYVLFDRPCRVFLHTEHEFRIFGNIWLLNDSLIFRDDSGVLEGEQLVRGSGTRYHLRHFEQFVMYHGSEFRSRFSHHCLRRIVTTPSISHSLDGAFEDWTALSRPAPHSIEIHIYGLQESPESTSSLDLPPPPPTFERPEYRVLCMAINTLEDDILLIIFDFYRLADENAWNNRIGWCKLSHVCRRWRQLIYESASHLDMHIICNKGTPIVDTLDHLPPLPVLIEYCLEIEPANEKWERVPTSGEDDLGIYPALRLHDRVRRIDLQYLWPSTLHKSIMLMDETFPILEHLYLSFPPYEISTLTLPPTFLAPNLRHLTLRGLSLPKRLRLLISTVSLVTLTLWGIPASSYFSPRLLVARLQSLHQLEFLCIGFSVPIPRPSAERLLLGKQGTPVTLPNMKYFTFQGVSAYLECLVSRIRAPLLQQLEVVLFNQVAFTLPHLTHFINTAEHIELPTLIVSFWSDEVSITKETVPWDRCFVLRVKCKPLDWQIDCITQICSALMPALSGVEKLGLKFEAQTMPTEWQNGEIDGTTWHDLLRSFIAAKELHVVHSLSEELSHALEVGEIGSDPSLLPDLQEIKSRYHGADVDTLFGSFIHARRAAGRPISLHIRPSQGIQFNSDLS